MHLRILTGCLKCMIKILNAALRTNRIIHGILMGMICTWLLVHLNLTVVAGRFVLIRT